MLLDYKISSTKSKKDCNDRHGACDLEDKDSKGHQRRGLACLFVKKRSNK